MNTKVTKVGSSPEGLVELRFLLDQEISHPCPINGKLSFYAYSLPHGIVPEAEYKEGEKKLLRFKMLNARLKSAMNSQGQKLLEYHEELLSAYAELKKFDNKRDEASPLLFRIEKLRKKMLRLIDKF